MEWNWRSVRRPPDSFTSDLWPQTNSGDLARQSRTLFLQYFPQNRSFLSQMYCRDLEVVYAYHATLFQVMSINCIHSVRVCEFQLNTEDLLLKD